MRTSIASKPEAFNELIAATYAAALDDSGWDRLLDGMAAFLGHGVSLMLSIQHIAGQRQTLPVSIRCLKGLDWELATAFERECATNLNALRLVRLISTAPVGVPLSSESLLGRKTIERLIEYRRYYRPQSLDAEAIGTVLERRHNVQSLLNVFRPAGSRPFEREHFKALSRLAPHLKNAVGVWGELSHLRERAGVYEASLEQLALGVLVIGPGARVQFLNGCAESVLPAIPSLVLRGGRLIGRTREMQTALDRATRPPSGPETPTASTIMLSTRPGGLMLPCRIVPVPAVAGEAFALQPWALVLIGRQDMDGPFSPQHFTRLFGVSTRQGEILALLARGLTLSEAADRLAIEKSTAKTHATRAFDKLGVHSQSGFLAYLARSPANLFRCEPATSDDAPPVQKR